MNRSILASHALRRGTQERHKDTPKKGTNWRARAEDITCCFVSHYRDVCEVHSLDTGLTRFTGR